eukprot:365734-Chlamydomonas_euryale.AAC.4
MSGKARLLPRNAATGHDWCRLWQLGCAGCWKPGGISQEDIGVDAPHLGGLCISSPQWDGPPDLLQSPLIPCRPRLFAGSARLDAL